MPYFSDISLSDWQAFMATDEKAYEFYVPEENRSWIVRDDPDDESQAYSQEEKEALGKIMWQDFSTLG